MTDEEKLQEYLRKNALKAEKPEEPEPEPPAPVISRSKTKPKDWHNREVSAQFFWGPMFMLVPLVATLGFMNSNMGLDSEEAFTYGLMIGLPLVAINTLWCYYRVRRFSNLMSSKYYPLSGYKEFFAKRSPEFWEERNYTKVRISFNLTDEATDLHREALKTFTARMIEKWDKQYQDKDLDWIGKVPKDLQTNGTQIYGDISQRELKWMLKILVKFIPLSELLKTALKDVVVKSDTGEKTHTMKEEDDSDDAFERSESWNRRHSD